MPKKRDISKRLVSSRILMFIYGRVFIALIRWLPVPSTIFGPVKGRHDNFAEWLSNENAKKIDQKRNSSELKHWIHFLKPAKSIKETSPILAIPKIPHNLMSESIHNRPNIFLANIHWGRIVTRYFEVISPDDMLFDDFFFPPPGKNFKARCQLVPRLPKLQKKKGTYATFANYRAVDNYYHWVINCLTRLWVLELGKVENYKLLIPEKLLPFQEQTLDMLGFTSDRIEFFGDEHWIIENLIVPSYVMAPRHCSIEACNWLKNKLLFSIENVDAKLPKRIYISRSDAPKRKIINEKELVKFLERYEFVSIKAETMTIRDQIRHFEAAEIVVAPHGAGLTNILFMKKDCLVIELIPSRRAKPHFCNLASALGLKYVCITDAEEIETKSKAKERNPEEDFKIPIKRLASAFQTLKL